MIVEGIAVGTELLLGQVVNSNAAQIAARLADAGLDHYQQTVVGDNLDRIAAALRWAVERADAVILTGGIGPTPDDLTRQAICAATGLEMDFDEVYADHLRGLWASRGREMPASNLRQAERPRGAELIANPKGTAPGLRLRAGETWIFALPGVPEEMLPMLEGEVIPFLVREAGTGSGVLVSRVLRTWGESESRIGELLDELFRASINPTVAFLASAGEIRVRLTARGQTREEAEALIDPVADEVMRRLGSRVFALGEATIEEIVLGLLGERGWGLAVAESATGGTIAGRITSVAGSSKSFLGGVVAYHPRLKEELLGVSASV
ncbi:MAG: CinA family nicotinamide mononucleotide deamidase-related protein, partial [Acidimicrobiia bacterium]